MEPLSGVSFAQWRLRPHMGILEPFSAECATRRYTSANVQHRPGAQFNAIIGVNITRSNCSLLTRALANSSRLLQTWTARILHVSRTIAFQTDGYQSDDGWFRWILDGWSNVHTRCWKTTSFHTRCWKTTSFRLSRIWSPAVPPDLLRDHNHLGDTKTLPIQ